MNGAFESPSTLDFEWFSSMITKMCLASGATGRCGGAGCRTCTVFTCFGLGFGFAELACTATSVSAPTSSAMSAVFLCIVLPSSRTDDGPPTRLGPGPNLVVHPPLGPQGLADLADGAERAQGLAQGRQEVRLALRRLAHRRERPPGLLGASLRPHPRRPLELPPLGGRIEPAQL